MVGDRDILGSIKATEHCISSHLAENNFMGIIHPALLPNYLTL